MRMVAATQAKAGESGSGSSRAMSTFRALAKRPGSARSAHSRTMQRLFGAVLLLERFARLSFVLPPRGEFGAGLFVPLPGVFPESILPLE